MTSCTYIDGDGLRCDLNSGHEPRPHLITPLQARQDSHEAAVGHLTSDLRRMSGRLRRSVSPVEVVDSRALERLLEAHRDELHCITPCCSRPLWVSWRVPYPLFCHMCGAKLPGPDSLAWDDPDLWAPIAEDGRPTWDGKPRSTNSETPQHADGD